MKFHFRTIWFISLLMICLTPIIFKKDSKYFANLVIFHTVSSWLLVFVISNFKTNHLMNYLKEKYRHDWEFINTYPIFGFGFTNQHRLLKFVRKKDSDTDAVLISLKCEYIKFNRFIYIVIFSPFITIVLANILFRK